MFFKTLKQWVENVKFCFQDKQQNKKLSPNSAQQMSYAPFKEVLSEVMSLSVTPLLMTQGKEQLMQIIELAHHLNTISVSIYWTTKILFKNV